MPNIKRCPNCRLVNPESALRCDCGYDFDAAELKESLLSDAEKVHGVSSSVRFCGWAIDGTLIGLLTWYFNFVFGDSGLRRFMPWLPAPLFFSASIMTITYYFLFEYYLRRTPGKLLMGLRVERAGGGVPTAGEVLIRTLVRFVPLEPFSGPGRWWHDRWSHTQVIRG
jgi:uncharacterized RDD family membrane protein YckC